MTKQRRFNKTWWRVFSCRNCAMCKNPSTWNNASVRYLFAERNFEVGPISPLHFFPAHYYRVFCTHETVKQFLYIYLYCVHDLLVIPKCNQPDLLMYIQQNSLKTIDCKLKINQSLFLANSHFKVILTQTVK